MKIVFTGTQRQYDALHYLAVRVDKIEPNDLLKLTVEDLIESREHQLPENLKYGTETHTES